MKKGFTLIELLGVIVLLGIIGLIIVPAVQGSIESSASKLCNDQIKMFEDAAKNYVSKNPFKYECETLYEITLQELMASGILDKNELKNPKNNQDFSGTVNVTVTCSNNNYSFNYKYAPGSDDEKCD